MQTTEIEVANAKRAALYARLTMLGIALYIVIDIIAQLLPPHYNPISQAESDLGVGPYGWVMSLNFVLRGLIALAFVLALRDGLPTRARSRAGEALLLVWGGGSVILALFATDVSAGHHTVHGLVHLVVALVAFLAVAIGELLLSARLGADSRLRTSVPIVTLLAVLAVIAMLVSFVSLTTGVFGLSERTFLALALIWQAVVAARISAFAP